MLLVTTDVSNIFICFSYDLSYLKKYSLYSFWSSGTGRWYSPNSSCFLNMFCIQNLGEAPLNDLCKGIFSFCVFLKVAAKGLHLPRKHPFYSAPHFYLFFFFRPYFFELWTSTNYLFLQWKLFNFSTWNKKSGPNVISSYFTLIHNGNQTLHNRNTKTIKCYYKYNFWPFLLNAVVNGIYKTIVLGRQQYCQHIGHPKYQSKLNIFCRFSWGKKNIYKFR